MSVFEEYGAFKKIICSLCQQVLSFQNSPCFGSDIKKNNFRFFLDVRKIIPFCLGLWILYIFYYGNHDCFSEENATL